MLCQILASDKIQNPDYINSLATKFRDHRFLIVVPVRERQTKVNIVSTNTTLYYYYLKHKKSTIPLKFDIFITKVINGEILLKGEDLNLRREDEVDFSSLPILFYRQKGIQALKDRYFKQDLQNRLKLKKEFNNNNQDLNGLIYIMFLNNYYIHFDDYSGYLYFFKN